MNLVLGGNGRFLERFEVRATDRQRDDKGRASSAPYVVNFPLFSSLEYMNNVGDPFSVPYSGSHIFPISFPTYEKFNLNLVWGRHFCESPFRFFFFFKSQCCTVCITGNIRYALKKIQLYCWTKLNSNLVFSSYQSWCVNERHTLF